MLARVKGDVDVDVEVEVGVDVGILAVSKGPQSQFRYCRWYRSSHGTDFDISETADLVLWSMFGGYWVLWRWGGLQV